MRHTILIVTDEASIEFHGARILLRVLREQSRTDEMLISPSG